MSVPADSTVPAWLLAAVQDVVLLAIDGEAEGVCNRLEEIGNEGGMRAMFSACVAWATAIGELSGTAAAMKRMNADGVAISKLDGTSVDQTDPKSFAPRFFACVMNGDLDTAHALFSAPVRAGDRDRHQTEVIDLISMLAQFGRLRQAEVDAKRDANEGMGPP